MSSSKKFAHFEVQQDQVTTVHFNVPSLFDDLLIEELKNDLIGFLEQDKPEKLLIDFSDVQFCSSIMINCLLRAKKFVTRDNAGQMKLAAMSEDVLQSFKMLNLDQRVFEIFDTVDEAEAAFDS